MSKCHFFLIMKVWQYSGLFFLFIISSLKAEESQIEEFKPEEFKAELLKGLKEIPHELKHGIYLTPQKDKLQEEWTFSVERSGEYVLQLIHGENTVAPGFPFKVRWGFDDLGAEQDSVSKYLLNIGGVDKVFSEVGDTVRKGTFNLSANKSYTLKLQSDVKIDLVRIVPHFKNCFSSDEYLAQWQKMFDSEEKKEALSWFKEAKFGMFIHWGLYSELGGMWKGAKIEDSVHPGPRVAEWLMFTFKISRAEYEVLAKGFNPDSSFAEKIVHVAKGAGMKYIVLTSKHHDGFALFDSAHSKFDVVDAAPYGKDLVLELYNAATEAGLGFGVYYSHGKDWMEGADGNYNEVRNRNDRLGLYTHAQGNNLWDPSANTHKEYLENKAYPQIEELVKAMPKLRLIWFDGEGLITEEEAFRFYKMIYDLNPNVLVNRRVGYQFGDYLDAGDNTIPDAEQVKNGKYWETCGTMNHSWGYKPYDTNWKSRDQLLFNMIDIISKGGNYLLNVGPDGKGVIPEASVKGLQQMGEWLQINGEAVYGSGSWNVLHELSGGEDDSRIVDKDFWKYIREGDYWYTAKGDNVYAISLKKAAQTIRIRAMGKKAGEIKKLTVLGVSEVIQWTQTDEFLEVENSEHLSSDQGFVIKAEF